MKDKNNLRVGLGFDSHLFSSHGTLILGGVKFPGIHALKGHSDGDALLHALIDALLGAAGLGDIGEYFSDQSKKTKNMSSLLMLKQMMVKIKKKGFSINNIDLVLVAEKPKISKAKKKIIRLISKACAVLEGRVNLKGKTPEGLNIFKAPGGVAVWAAVALK